MMALEEMAISIHAPREGSDRNPNRPNGGNRRFQSTLPVRGATGGAWRAEFIFNISIHAPREGSDDKDCILATYGGISIHAPREGSDKKSSVAW